MSRQKSSVLRCCLLRSVLFLGFAFFRGSLSRNGFSHPALRARLLLILLDCEHVFLGYLFALSVLLGGVYDRRHSHQAANEHPSLPFFKCSHVAFACRMREFANIACRRKEKNLWKTRRRKMRYNCGAAFVWASLY